MGKHVFYNCISSCNLHDSKNLVFFNYYAGPRLKKYMGFFFEKNKKNKSCWFWWFSF